MSETSLPANVDFSSVNTLKTVLSVLVLLSFLDGVCNLCVCVCVFLFLGRLYELLAWLVLPIVVLLHCIYCHFLQLNVNVNANS